MVSIREHTSKKGGLVPPVLLVRPPGFEPGTSWSVAKRSIQLSYGRTDFHGLDGYSNQSSALRSRRLIVMYTVFKDYDVSGLQAQE